MQEGDTLACKLSGESARGLWAQSTKKSKYHRLTQQLRPDRAIVGKR